MKKVYLDNAATTKVSGEVLAAMKPYFSRKYGNASEPHLWGAEAKQGINEAREKVASFLGAKPNEIFFTSCATESINLSHKGLIERIMNDELRIMNKKPHIITTQIEHKAVIETCKHLEKLGWAEVTYLPVDKYGLVSVEDVKRAIKLNTVLVSIMYVNNEVGTIQPIAEIGKLIKSINAIRQSNKRIFFHTDATQGIQYLDCNVDRLGVDLLSMTGHKLYAPKGIGALYVRLGTPLVRQQDGGGQELGLRAGTENVPYIVGLGKAIEIAEYQISNIKYQIERLRDKLIEGVLKIPGTKLTGHPEKRAPHIASFVIEGVEGEAMLLYLSEKGIAASSGSACTSGTLEPSHVLTAMGIPAETAHGSLRFSLGKDTTEEEINYVLEVLPKVAERVRKMAPKLLRDLNR
jgi:cysteine desulfurase